MTSNTEREFTVEFQSLRGILDRFNCPHIEHLVYLIFKVRLREAALIIYKKINERLVKSLKSIFHKVREGLNF